MIIKRLILENWKNFPIVDVDLNDRVFIVGPNAAGKSNLLDSIRFLRDVVKQGGGLQYAVENRGGIRKIRSLSARAISHVSIEMHLGEPNDETPKWKYKLVFKHTGGGLFKNEVAITRESVWSREKSDYILNRPNAAEEDSETLKYTHLEQITTNKGFREIYNFFSEIQYLHIVPQLVRDHNSYFLSKDKEDFYGRNFLEKISVVNDRTKKAYLRSINEVLKLAVPQIESLEFKKDNVGIPHLEARYLHWRAKGNKQQEDQFSDGTLRLIGLLWALLDGSETVLLEEPEINLHSEIIKQLPEFISSLQRRKSKTRQVIITTHSYEMLDNSGISSEEILILIPSKEGTAIEVASNLNEINSIIQAGFTPAQATIKITSPKDISKISQLKLF
ncbi:putative ATPase [Mucilaginibacter oryzae]|uniref:Putative ATPase n=1 Tax=Mucilaginibacter oryzae TaxID=468058 RepID=A0A316H245_9SPHI|nr:ATP-binding protein [Mucilaginibacter oryzae]PWK74142.1 putative ATPase [Mucilaginibacter oryzae]